MTPVYAALAGARNAKPCLTHSLPWGAQSLSGRQFEALEDRVQRAEARSRGACGIGAPRAQGEGLAPGSLALDWPEDSGIRERAHHARLGDVSLGPV